jgi:formiminotetrahydrofolate cyclodeaminase
MPRFADMTVADFVGALASSEPTPGGGTAAAIAGAMGTSLLMMVAGLAKSRGGTEHERVALAEARAALESVRERLIALADIDTEAFDQVMAAYRQPKNTDQEKTARKDAISQALKGATIAPLDILRASAEAMRLARVVAEHGNRSAVSDVGVGIGLLQAAVDGAIANVRINLGSLQDAAFNASAAQDIEQIGSRVTEHNVAARRDLEG